MMKISWNQHSKNSGFTLLEMLIVAFIIIILSIIVVTNYEFGGYKSGLQRSAHKLAQDIRRAEEMAMSAKEFGGSVPLGGYGIYVSWQAAPTSTQYILFADTNGDKEYDAGEEIEDPINFEDFNQIHMACIEDDCAWQLSVTFTPPDPTIRFNGDASSSAHITLESIKVEGYVTVWVNNVGLIEVQQGKP